MFVARYLIAVAALAALAGCGPRYELGQVRGTVSAGGHPLSNVVVMYVPETTDQPGTPGSTAQTDAAGRYALSADTGSEGAAVGKHRVVLRDLAIQKAPRSADGTVLKRPPARFAADYGDPLRTPLVVEVRSGEQTIDLELNIGP
jgi:hypothetical protein